MFVLIVNFNFNLGVAKILSFVLPWIICIPLQTGNHIFPFQIWTSLIFVSTSNFIIPVLILFKCKDFRRKYNSDRVLSDKQLDLLKRIHKRSSRLIQHLKEKKDTSHTLQTTPSSEHNGLTIVVALPNSANSPTSPSADYLRHHNLATTHNDHHVSESTEALSKLLEDDVPDPDAEDLSEEQQRIPSQIDLPAGITDRFRNSVMSQRTAAADRESSVQPPNDIPEPIQLGSQDPNLSTSQATMEQISKPIREVDFPFSDSTVIPTLNREPLKRAERVDRRDTLPVHPQFRTPAFRSVPRWMPFKSNYMGAFILILTTIVTVINIILNLVKHSD